MVFGKKTCERCGEQYRGRTFSESKGRHLCRDCVKHCSVCGEKLPWALWFGQTTSVTQFLIGNVFTQSKEREEKPWIGSGLCMKCYRTIEDKKLREEQLIREAQIAQARETLETPTVWVCQYCRTVNRGRFCSNCGVSRKQEVRELSR